MMCLAIPGEILSIDESDPLTRPSKVSFGGTIREISLGLVPEAQVGQYVLVHAGVAIGTVDEDEAQETFDLLEDLALSDKSGDQRQ